MQQKYVKFYLLLFLLVTRIVISAQTSEQLRLPSILSNHMVLQQNSDVNFWGWAKPRTIIKIIPSWSNDTIFVKTSEKAKWETVIKTPSAGGPYSINVVARDQNIVIDDVLVGELWLCSGQSNMEWNVNTGIIDAKEELENCTNNQIRFFFVEKTTADYPQDNCSGYWKVCTPESMQYFSSVGYFFGKKIHEYLKAPIGLINSNWGGTAAETWTPSEKIEKKSILYQSWKKLRSNDGWDNRIGTTYNAMIAPIIKMKLAGIIWYQGEANVPAAATYSELFSTMIKAWREKFRSNLPFYYVQIAPYNKYAIPYSAALLREQQEAIMTLDNTGMVVISDHVDDINDIHPRYKKPVADRLANWALSETYQLDVGEYKSPSFNRMEIEKNAIRVYLNDAESGIEIRGKSIETLEVAGDDGVYFPASGKIDKKTNSIVVTSKKIKKIRNIRYSFSNNSIGNLFSTSGLPVSPFRTDTDEIGLRGKKE